MPYDPQKHHRRSIRLKGYDYTQPGAYFVTLVAHQRDCLFGEIVDDKMRLNAVGELAQGIWLSLPRHFPALTLDEWVIMPNHLHGVLVIGGAGEADHRKGEASAVRLSGIAEPLAADASPLHGTQSASVGAIVQNYKSVTARKINAHRRTPGALVWQRNYYEHIVRNDADLHRIRQYIVNNPLKWTLDDLHR